MFHRQLVTKLNRLAKQFPVLAITGSRQIGKSTLARMYAEAVGKELVFYDLENPVDFVKSIKNNMYEAISEMGEKAAQSLQKAKEKNSRTKHYSPKRDYQQVEL